MLCFSKSAQKGMSSKLSGVDRKVIFSRTLREMSMHPSPVALMGKSMLVFPFAALTSSFIKVISVAVCVFQSSGRIIGLSFTRYTVKYIPQLTGTLCARSRSIMSGGGITSCSKLRK